MASRREEADTVRRSLTKSIRENLHEVRRFLNLETEQRIGVRVHCPAYPQGPAVSREDREFGVEEIDPRWEPGLGDGPINARFSVVDLDGDTDVLTPPVRWDADRKDRHFLSAPISGSDGIALVEWADRQLGAVLCGLTPVEQGDP